MLNARFSTKRTAVKCNLKNQNTKLLILQLTSFILEKYTLMEIENVAIIIIFSCSK